MFYNTSLSRHHAWIGVLSLGFAAFVFNTSEFVPIGLLSDISQSFGMSHDAPSIMITIYAWVVALLSLPLILIFSNTERKILLIFVFLIFILSQIMCFFATTFDWLIVGRIGVAVAHALFWSITSALAIRIAPVGKKSQALAIIATGTSLAAILGVPLGRIIGTWLGWRYTFLTIGLIATIVLVILIVVLPKLPSINTGSIKSLPSLLKRPALIGIFILTIIVVAGHFSTYTFFEQFALETIHLSENDITLLLLFFGFSGIVGSFIFGSLNNKHPLILLPSGTTLLLIILLILSFIHIRFGSFFLVIFFWGIAFTCVALSLQVKVLDLSADATDISMAIYSGLFNLGIGSGALIGRISIDHIGIKSVSLVGSCVEAFALSLILFLTLYYKKTFIEKALANKGGK